MNIIVSSVQLAVGRPCPYCRVPMTQQRKGPFFPAPRRGIDATREHVFPASRGGRIVIIACHRCNGEKGDLSPYEWIEHLYRIDDATRAEHTIRAYVAIGGVFRDEACADEIIEAARGLAMRSEVS